MSNQTPEYSDLFIEDEIEDAMEDAPGDEEFPEVPPMPSEFGGIYSQYHNTGGTSIQVDCREQGGGGVETVPLLNSESSEPPDDTNTSELSESQSACRICFEHSPIIELIRPCRCTGTMQYVHRDCLDQWRASDNNPEAFSKCGTCNYNYVIQDVYSVRGYYAQCNRYLARHVWFLFLINLSSIICTGTLLAKIDTGKVIPELFTRLFTSIATKQSIHYYFYYYLISSWFYLLIMVVFFIGNLICMRHRRIFLKNYFGDAWRCAICRLFCLLLLLSLSFFLNVIFGCLILTVEIQLMLSIHFTLLNHYYRAQEQHIVNYNPEQDTRAGVVTRIVINADNLV